MTQLVLLTSDAKNFELWALISHSSLPSLDARRYPGGLRILSIWEIRFSEEWDEIKPLGDLGELLWICLQNLTSTSSPVSER